MRMTPSSTNPRNFRNDIVFAFALAIVCYFAWFVRDVLMLLYVSALFAVVLNSPGAIYLEISHSQLDAIQRHSNPRSSPGTRRGAYSVWLPRLATIIAICKHSVRGAGTLTRNSGEAQGASPFLNA